MTKEEAIYCMMSYLPDNSVEHCTSCPYYGANQMDANSYSCKSNEAHMMAIEALKKQMPMQVTDIHVDEYYCPNCGAENNKSDDKNYSDNYCPNCGQKLSWIMEN